MLLEYAITETKMQQRFFSIIFAFSLSITGVIASEKPRDWLIDASDFKAQVNKSADGRELELTNGLIRRVIRIQPNAATVALDNLVTGETLLRGVKPEAAITLDGKQYEIGGLKGQLNYAFLRSEWLEQLQADPKAFRFVGFEIGQPKERLEWKQTRHHAPDVQWPPKGIYLRLDFALPTVGQPEPNSPYKDIGVSIHYELYDGLPCFSKWMTLENASQKNVRLDRFSSELLAVVERTSEVDTLVEGKIAPNIHIETDMAFGGMMAAGANRRSYRWLADPEFETQVNYEKKTPCLLDIGPDLGPALDIPPGEKFESYRAWELFFDSTDRERSGLSVRRMYRIIAPWATENPLMLHLVSSQEETVLQAIDQCAEVGFEMLILSFGSGFNLENENAITYERAKKFSEYAKRKGIEIGSYSLLASRKVGGGDDVVMPPGETPTFGESPCLVSAWGDKYFRRLRQFHEEIGFTLLEHDGSYPGDPCASETHPGHHGLADSRWKQWREISDFYKWCRGKGIYLNVPDHYFLDGSNKTAMGYRETNWSLPREQQVIHTRQNIFDGTWEKTPSMGWMFVPLTQYHGGGAAATIEPLDEHLDHYERMMESNLALGVQACYRGPRLFDTDRTKAMVKSKVDWFKAHRDILESDLIHGRRCDARNLDWMMHVNPKLKEKGMLVVFNPLDRPLSRNLSANLYYTGLTESASVTEQNGEAKQYKLARDYTIELPVEVPAQGMKWFVIQ